MSRTLHRDAIGQHDGASLVLHTARARVEIVCRDIAPEANRHDFRWQLRGDVPLEIRARDGAGRTPIYETPTSALTAALECLAAYNRG